VFRALDGVSPPGRKQGQCYFRQVTGIVGNGRGTVYDSEKGFRRSDAEALVVFGERSEMRERTSSELGYWSRSGWVLLAVR
jgi:hypothetical protein